MKTIIKCKVCDNKFYRKKTNSKKQHCSWDCENKDKKLLETNKKFSKECLNCDNKFYTNKNHQVFCEQSCRNIYYAKQWDIDGFRFEIPSGTVGVLSEYLASIDLMKKGYEVYRAMSPASSSDLILKKNNKFISIEVRTGKLKINNEKNDVKLHYPKHHMRSDHFAIVIPEKNKIIYIPELL